MIDDVNDNDPVFNTSSYVAKVMENSNTSTSVATVYATDQDQGENGYVTYKITGGNTGDVFQVDNQTGVVSVKGSIDRERISEYSLTIQAEDGGDPSSRKVRLTSSWRISSLQTHHRLCLHHPVYHCLSFLCPVIQFLVPLDVISKQFSFLSLKFNPYFTQYHNIPLARRIGSKITLFVIDVFDMS